MTAEKPFTNEELDELAHALETQRHHLAKIYANANTAVDWHARDERLLKLKDKIIGMKS